MSQPYYQPPPQPQPYRPEQYQPQGYQPQEYQLQQYPEQYPPEQYLQHPYQPQPHQPQPHQQIIIHNSTLPSSAGQMFPRKHHSVGVHILLLLFTGGVGNLIYWWMIANENSRRGY